MWNQVEAFARTLRAIAQGLITVAAFAAWEAGQAALAAHGWQPRTIAIAALTAGITAIVTYVYNLIAPRLGISGKPSVEGLVRAGRTLLAGALATGLVAAGEAILAAVQAGDFDVRVVGTSAAATFVTVVVAYIHNVIRPRTTQN